MVDLSTKFYISIRRLQIEIVKKNKAERTENSMQLLDTDDEQNEKTLPETNL